MKLPLSWIRDYVDIKISPEELAQKLTFAGLEVEEMQYIGIPRPPGSRATGDKPELAWDRDKIFVGEILSVEQHPNADRLTLVNVAYGAAEPIKMVTGAPNIKVGGSGYKVVLALEGSRLFDGHQDGWKLMTLKKSKIRGIESGSMVCSEKELGISEEHEGIILLPDDAPVGTPLVDYLGDIVLDIKINPNMARCASVIGIAREVAALTGQPLKPVPQKVIAKGAADCRSSRCRHQQSGTESALYARIAQRHIDQTIAVLDATPARACRDAPHQQHRRCDELRDARNRSAASRVRLR